MRKISVLSSIVSITYYVLILVFFIESLSIFKAVNITEKSKLKNVKIISEPFDLSTANSEIIIITGCVAMCVFLVLLIAVYHLKKSMKDLVHGAYFSKTVIKSFKNLGVLLVVMSIIELVAVLVLGILINSELLIRLDSSNLFYFVLGLFFMFLSEVFQKGRTMKEENDLTI
jgi:hypothetical protein